MENEAASVEDRAWGREARRAGALLDRRRVAGLLLVATSVYVVLGLAMCSLFYLVSMGYAPTLQPALPVLTLLCFLMPPGATFWLIRRNLRPTLACLAPVSGSLLMSLLGPQFITRPIGLAGVQGAKFDLLPLMPVSVFWEPPVESLLATALGALLGLTLARRTRQQRRA